MIELKIEELVYRYKNECDAFSRIRPKIKKEMRDFQQWLDEQHLKENDIIEHERIFFDFCSYCKETTCFHCHLPNFSWEFDIACKCEMLRLKNESEMEKRIAKSKKFQKELENAMQRLF